MGSPKLTCTPSYSRIPYGQLATMLILHAAHSIKGDNEAPLSGVLVIGEEASSDNPIDEGMFCFNITLDSDIYKEGLEIFILHLQSDDECVYLGRDLALARVQANGGII